MSPLQEALPRSGEQEDPRGQRLQGKAVSGASLQLLGGSPRPTGPTPAPQRQHWFRLEGPTPLKQTFDQSHQLLSLLQYPVEMGEDVQLGRWLRNFC